MWSEFYENGEYAGGFDLPRRDCPNCGHPLQTNGHDIPFAIFLGFEGDKVPIVPALNTLSRPNNSSVYL